MGQSPTSTDTEMEYSNNTNSVEGCSFRVNKTVLEPGENGSNARAGNDNTKREAPQKVETGTNTLSTNSGTPQYVDHTPQNSIDWNELGNSYASSRKFDNAIEAYKKAIEMNPKYGQPYSNLGFIYYRLGKNDVAILLYKKSIDFLDTPEDKAVSWNRLGDAYRRLGDYGNASAAYQKASEMAPVDEPGNGSRQGNFIGECCCRLVLRPR